MTTIYLVQGLEARESDSDGNVSYLGSDPQRWDDQELALTEARYMATLWEIAGVWIEKPGHMYDTEVAEPLETFYQAQMTEEQKNAAVAAHAAMWNDDNKDATLAAALS
jgi:hypothetical protein